jgi:hypothetical protein
MLNALFGVAYELETPFFPQIGCTQSCTQNQLISSSYLCFARIKSAFVTYSAAGEITIRQAQVFSRASAMPRFSISNWKYESRYHGTVPADEGSER